MAKNKNPNPYKIVPNNLWMYRKKLRLTQKQVAYLMGLKSPSHISNYEPGLKLPSLENALKLEAVLGGVMVSFLFWEHFSQIRQEIHERRKALHSSLGQDT